MQLLGMTLKKDQMTGMTTTTSQYVTVYSTRITAIEMQLSDRKNYTRITFDNQLYLNVTNLCVVSFTFLQVSVNQLFFIIFILSKLCYFNVFVCVY